MVVAQWPNTALVTWLVASLAMAVLGRDGWWSEVLRGVATLALGWWAIDEVIRGVNPWRRLLGTVVLAGLVASRLL
jgi:hypothetical protein